MTQHGVHSPYGPVVRVRVRRGGSRFARGPRTGRPRRPHDHRRRRGPGWALLALSVAMLVVGMTLPHGLLLASGLVTAGTAVYLLAPPQDPDRPALP